MQVEREDRRSGWRRPAYVALLYLLGVTASLATGLMAPLIFDLQRAFNATAGMIGLAYGMMFLPIPLLATLAGNQIDAFGARKTIIVGGTLILLASLSNLFAHHWLIWLLANNFVLGCGLMTVALSGQTEVSKIFSEKRQSTALSIWAAAPFAGISIGLMLSGLIAGTPWWRVAFAVHGSLIIGFALLAYLICPDDAGRPERGGHGSRALLRAIVGERAIFRLAGIGLLHATLSSGTRAVWPLYLSKTHDVSMSTIAGMAAAASPVSILGAFTVGCLLSKRSGFGLLLVGCGCLAVGSGLGLYAPSSSLAVVGLAMFSWSFAVGGLAALIFAMLPKVVGDLANLGTATGILHQIASIGAVIGAPLFFATAAIPGSGFLLIAQIAAAWVLILALMPLWRAGNQASAGGVSKPV